MSPVLLNTVFECVGVILALHNISVALKTRPQGVSLLMVAWSCLWAVEAGWYYYAHGELIAASCAGMRFWALAVWTIIATSPKSSRL